MICTWFYFFYLFTLSLRAFPALNEGVVVAVILISSPVCGFLPVLAALSLVSKVPNPTNWTFPLLANSLETTLTNEFNTDSTSFLLS